MVDTAEMRAEVLRVSSGHLELIVEAAVGENVGMAFPASGNGNICSREVSCFYTFEFPGGRKFTVSVETPSMNPWREETSVEVGGIVAVGFRRHAA